MAKGRKILTTSRSERYLGRSYGYGHSQENSTNDSPELAEDDVWSMVDGMVNGNDHANVSRGGEGWSPRSPSGSSNGSLSGRISRRNMPRGDDVRAGGLSLAFDDPTRAASSPRIVHQFRGPDATPRGRRHVATSLPLNVPDWTKIYRVDSVESLPDSDEGFEDCDLQMVPPHEYLARSRNAAANSVFEGVGRTLKGRDMSRVRDAVWSQTGFDG